MTRFARNSGFGLVFYALLATAPVAAATNLVAAVLPNSRSVEVNTPATLFATIINAGAEAAQNCRIEPDAAFSGSFLYQTTNPATNAPTGNANTPIDLAPGAAQTFLLALTPNGVQAPIELAPRFLCDNAPVVATINGVNTFSFSASSTPVADVVALAATRSADGVLILPNAAGTNAFAVATVNVGASSTLTVTAELSDPSLAARVDLCQTDAATGVCINPAAPTNGSVTFSVNNLETPTFSLFITATGDVPFDPANNRVFLRFRDSTGAVRGSTSVALRLRTPDDGLPIDTSNGAGTLESTLDVADMAAKLVGVAQLGLQRAINARTAPDVQECNPGTVTYEFFDDGLDGRLGAGDRLRVSFNNCNRLSLFEAFVSGTVEINITSAVFVRGDDGSYVEGTIRTTDLAIDTNGEVETVDATLDFTFQVGASGENYEVNAEGDDVLALTRNGVTEQLGNFTLVRSANNTNDYIVGFSAQVRSEEQNGTFDCTATNITGRPHSFNLINSGELRCTGRYATQVVADSAEVLVDASGAGSFVQASSFTPWQRVEAVLGARVIPGLSRAIDRTDPILLAVAIVDLPVTVMATSDLTDELFVFHDLSLSIVALADGSIQETITLPDTVVSLAVSDDGSTLMIGYLNNNQAQTFSTSSRTLGTAFDLRANPGDPSVLAKLVTFLPGDNDSVVVALAASEFGLPSALVRYDSGVRADVVADSPGSLSKMAFAADGRLFGENSDDLKEFLVDASGVTQGGIRKDIASRGDSMVATGAALYDSAGYVMSYDDTQIHGTFGARDLEGETDGRFGELDAVRERVYQIEDDRIGVYDLNRFVPIAYWAPSWSLGTFEQLVQTTSSADHLVLGTDEKLLILAKDDIAPQTIESCPTIDLGLFGDTSGTRQIDCAFTELAYDAGRDRILALTPSLIGENGNSVAVINTATGLVEKYVYAGSAPTSLSLSADGNGVFVGLAGSNRVVRVDLVTDAVTTEAVLVNTSQPSFGFQPWFATDVAASPSAAGDVVVASERNETLLISNGVIATNRISEFPRPQQVEFLGADGSRVYGLNDDEFFRADVDGDGLTLLTTTEGLVEGERMVQAGGRIYTSAGQKLDPDALLVEQSYDLGIRFIRDVAVDLVDGSVVFVTGTSGSSITKLSIFNESTGELAREMEVPQAGTFFTSDFFIKPRLNLLAPGHAVVSSSRGLLVVPKALVGR